MAGCAGDDTSMFFQCARNKIKLNTKQTEVMKALIGIGSARGYATNPIRIHYVHSPSYTVHIYEVDENQNTM